jgi:hypothetical protein
MSLPVRPLPPIIRSLISEEVVAVLDFGQVCRETSARSIQSRKLPGIYNPLLQRKEFDYVQQRAKENLLSIYMTD